MRLFTGRASALPPTRYHYQPPAGAVGVRWICPADDCGRGGPDVPGDRWPRRCPECGGGISTHHLAEPWQHDAKRVELDARLNGSPDYGDPGLARAEDLVWLVDDALRAGRPGEVAALAAALGALLDGQRGQDHGLGQEQRFHLVHLIIQGGLFGLAASVLHDWRKSVRYDDLEDNAQRTECRLLFVSAVHYLNEAMEAPTDARQAVWAMLRQFMPIVRDIATADMSRDFTRLSYAMAGRADPEEGDRRELARLADADRARPSGGLPPESPLRMAILGRFTLRHDSGIDATLIWQVCLQPFLDVSAEQLGAAVLPAGGWAVYGASRCLRELGTQDEDGRAYGEIWDAGLEFLHGTGASWEQLSFYDQQRWIRRHGPDSW